MLIQSLDLIINTTPVLGEHPVVETRRLNGDWILMR